MAMMCSNKRGTGHNEGINPYRVELFVYKPWRLKGFFQFEIIIDRLYLCGTASHWSMNVCTNLNKMVNLIKSHDNLHGITYRIKIMLKGIAIVKTLDIALK